MGSNLRLHRQSDRIIAFALTGALHLQFLPTAMKKRFRSSLDKRAWRLRAPPPLPVGRRPLPDPPPSNLMLARVELAALQLAKRPPVATGKDSEQVSTIAGQTP